jgi:hypothetical protein
MIGLLAQHILLSDQLVLLTEQNLFAGKSRPQQAFREPVTCQLAFVACGRTALRAFKNGARRRGRAVRRMFGGHVASLPCRVAISLPDTSIVNQTYDDKAKSH